MTLRLARAAAAAVTAVALLTACTDDSEPAIEEDAMYCDLINPETVQPITGGHQIKDFGGPVPKSDTRTIKCNLYDADDREDLLAVYAYEVTADKMAQERDETTRRMADHAAAGDAHYVAVDEDGVLGFAWFTGDVAAAHLLTEDRNISVTAPSSQAQAERYTAVVLEVARQIDANLDAWDAENDS